MASVPFDFLPPSEPDIVKLHIWQSPTREGAFTKIETVDAGTYPNYITRYTTNLATATDYWFSIQWENDKGAMSSMSDPVQGQTYSLVGKIKDRALLRDSSLDETIVTQEAEAAVTDYFGVDDPYSVNPADVTIIELTGLTYMAIARAHIATLIRSASSVQSYTAGLVSQKSGDSSTQGNLRDMIAYLLGEANKMLGRSYTVVMLLEDIDPTGTGIVSTIGVDQSRLLLSLE